MATVIEEVERVAGKGSVCAVVTYNVSNMRKSWELLEERLPTLTGNGCSAHTLNLLLKDMFGIGFIGDVLAKALAITNFVCKRPELLYHYRAKQRQRFGSRQRRRTLMIPVSTRWYSKTNCISCVVVNKEVLRDVFLNAELLSRYSNATVKLNRAHAILADNTLWTEARVVLRLVNPVTKVLGTLSK
ncbi:hypothetical protein L917_00584 [Phytophthora nicotianae]|uniref:DUF659 domain-containing protein n=1 Tax=Phytophthora nicotianae TaxID=4792 RepID=W2P106_PHYNI|nr:hypothetical protein L915_02196 [Phytophthora nicotianae]ETM03161.1 hypothetical protein L917_00584 [Phytophthora nicotianae]ETM54496.1 hypothetical protein L914_02176 [Phytophthora nicotianae]